MLVGTYVLQLTVAGEQCMVKSGGELPSGPNLNVGSR